jgi:Uri superfamily endonuclease
MLELYPTRYAQRYVTRNYTLCKSRIELHSDGTKDKIWFIPYLEHESVEDTVRPEKSYSVLHAE